MIALDTFEEIHANHLRMLSWSGDKITSLEIDSPYIEYYN